MKLNTKYSNNVSIKKTKKQKKQKNKIKRN